MKPIDIMNEFVAQLKDDQAAEGAESAHQSERLPDDPHTRRIQPR